VKKKFYNILFLCVFSACNSVHTEGEQEITKGNDTIGKLQVEVSNEGMRKMNTDNLLFEAHGTEPGWFVQLYPDRLRLLVEYGQDSVIISDAFENVETKTDYTYNKNTQGSNLELIIKNNSCIDAGSGDKLPKEVMVKWKEKSYKGCGKFLN
jgi:uncharacterized membrane protein